MKRCTVCRRVYSLPEYAALHAPCGGEIQDDGTGGELLLRNCGDCGTTLALPVEELPTNLRPKEAA